MRKVKKNRLLALLLMGLLLFSNYGIMAYADEIPASEMGSQDEAGQDAEGQQSEGQQSEGQQSEGQQSEGQQSEGQQSLETEPAKIVVDYKENHDDNGNGNEIIEKEVVYKSPGTSGNTVTEVVQGDKNKNYQTELFKVNDGQDIDRAYCNDKDTYIVTDSKYTVEELSGENADTLRGIILNGYDQSKGLKEYKDFLEANGFEENDVENLTEKDFITATQLAVWQLKNENAKFNVKNDKVKAISEFLVTKEVEPQTKSDLEIEAQPTDGNDAVKLENDKVVVNYTYSILNRVNEQVQTFLEVFVNGTKLSEGDDYLVVDLGNGSKSLSVSSSIENRNAENIISAEIVISGTYEVKDVYDLVPKDNQKTQALVSTPMLMSYNLPTLKQMFKIEYTAPKEEPGEEEPGEEEPGEEEPGEDELGEEPGEDEPVTPGGGGTTNPPVVEPQPEPTNPTPQPTTPIAQNDNDDDDEDIEDEATPLAAPQIIPVASPVATLASVEQTEEVIDEETPLSAPPVIETDEEIIEEEVPLDAPAPVLPKTGGFAPELLYALGASLIATGLKIRKK